MNKLFIILFLFPILSYSQIQSSKSITDSTLILGIVSDDIYVGKTISYCSNSIDKSLGKGTSVIVSGATKCSQTYTQTGDFYEIIHNNIIYYIKKENLVISKGYTFESLSTLPEDQVTLLKKTAKISADVWYNGRIDETIKFLKNCKQYGLAILDWSFYDESEYTNGTSVKINVYNPTSKTIKYIWFTFLGFNPVGDKVIDKTKGTSLITVKGVGPIEPEKNGVYKYTYVWFTDLVEKAQITSIKIQYMDSSIKIVSNPKLIILNKRLSEVLEEDE